MQKSLVGVIVLNWNDADLLPHSVGSLLKQSEKCDIIVVDNGSKDNSRKVIEEFGEKVVSLYNKRNKGFAGGINTGLRYALQQDYTHVALLNNDAVADKDWIKNLLRSFNKDDIGGATCSLLHKDGKTYDSTGDTYSTWGLPYPRGRDEEVKGQYDEIVDVFGVSGGGSMYRTSMLKRIGLFDEDFFAYYEDVDLSFRGQLAGWQFRFAPKAIAYHATGTTSSRIKGFTTRQTLKNLPWLLWKNTPTKLLPKLLPRFTLSYLLFVARALSRKQFRAVLEGVGASLLLMPKKLWQRWRILQKKEVDAAYIYSILTWDLPPNAAALRSLRVRWRKLRGKNA